jgi:hypothetical protein
MDFLPMKPSPSLLSPSNETVRDAYKNILFRLKHLGRPMATWMEAFSQRKIPMIGDLQILPAHLSGLTLIDARTSVGVITEVTPDREILVVYMAMRRRLTRK